MSVALIQVDEHIIHPDVADHPVLFLDIDGVLAETAECSS